MHRSTGNGRTAVDDQSAEQYHQALVNVGRQLTTQAVRKLFKSEARTSILQRSGLTGRVKIGVRGRCPTNCSEFSNSLGPKQTLAATRRVSRAGSSSALASALYKVSKLTFHMTRPTVFRNPTLSRDSQYSYACGACSRCCWNYQIRVNPYEVLRLAQHLKVSTTAFIEEYVSSETALVRKPDDSCIFLGTHGCSVHPARPLVCRLYPLGRHISSDGEERFFHMEPHPDTEGVYGVDGTVGDYLRSQGALPFLSAADRYLSIFQRYFNVLSELPKDAPLAGYDPEMSERQAPLLPELLDPEKAVDISSLGSNILALDPDGIMALHIEALEYWLSQFQREENGDEKQD